MKQPWKDLSNVFCYSGWALSSLSKLLKWHDPDILAWVDKKTWLAADYKKAKTKKSWSAKGKQKNDEAQIKEDGC